LIPKPSYLSVSYILNIIFISWYSSISLNIWLLHLKYYKHKYNSSFYFKIHSSITLFFLKIKKKKKPPTYPLRLLILNNACPYCFTAAAGTVIGQDFSIITIIILIMSNYLQPGFAFLFILSITGSSFRSLSKIPHCCLLQV